MRISFSVASLFIVASAGHADQHDVLGGLKDFYGKTARPDGSFSPGIDPNYRGMSDSAYSDLAAVTYACTIHKTFGWKLPHEEKTIAFLQSRQKETGEFFNVAGTVDPASAEGKTYNTTQGLVALRALGVKPRHYPLRVFDDILKEDYKTLPAYSTSFFPLAFLCYGQPIPARADRAIRALMVQDDTGYLNNHIAATFHASHYYRLIGETTPRAHEMVERIVREQKPDGSWLLNMPSRDRHATFDAVFTLKHEGQERADCAAAIARAVKWALSCRNPDGGFGHYPGSTSDADAVYFQVGVLVMGGYLQPSNPPPQDGRLLSWGHLMPLANADAAHRRIHLGGWVGGLAFSPDGGTLAAGAADKTASIWDQGGKRIAQLTGHADHVVAVAFSPTGASLATGSYDQTARIWDIKNAQAVQVLRGHRGPVLSVAFTPDGKRLATASIDGTIRLWNTNDGDLAASLKGHRSWVNSLSFSRDGSLLASGSSDGTVKLWNMASLAERHTIAATNGEVRSVALSPDGKTLAAGLRYGMVKIWDLPSGTERCSFAAHQGDAWCVALAPDGRLLSGGGDWNRPGFVRSWDPATGKQLTELQHSGEVLSLAVSPDNRFIAAGGGDNAVIIWPVTRYELQQGGDHDSCCRRCPASGRADHSR